MNEVLNIFPVFTFTFSLVVIALNMWLANKLNKVREEMRQTKDEVLNIVRNEIERRVEKLATQEQMKFLNREIVLMFKNMAIKLKLSTKDFDGDDKE